MDDFIVDHDSLKATVRTSLLPFQGESRIALKIGPVSAVALMLLFVSSFVGLVWHRRRYWNNQPSNNSSKGDTINLLKIKIQWIWSALKLPPNNSTPRCRQRSSIISLMVLKFTV